MSSLDALMGRVTLILLRPKYPENIGAAARAAWAMGIGQLVVIGTPLTAQAQEQALKMATHHAAHLVLGLRYGAQLAEVLADFVVVVGVTARRGRQRMAMANPEELAQRLGPTLVHGPVALLFGPEDTGLANCDLAACGLVVTIPTSDHLRSLNLAQAVMILTYALRQGLSQLEGDSDSSLYRPRLAGREELAAMFAAAHLACLRGDQLSGQTLAETRLRHLRQVVSRAQLSAREAKLLKDFCCQLTEFHDLNPTIVSDDAILLAAAGDGVGSLHDKGETPR